MFREILLLARERYFYCETLREEGCGMHRMQMHQVVQGEEQGPLPTYVCQYRILCIMFSVRN